MPVTGKVKWFSNVKGYGFIEQEGGEKDIFVHYSAITGDKYKTLDGGDTVTFEIVQSDKGPQAAEVVRQKKEKSKQESKEQDPKKPSKSK